MKSSEVRHDRSRLFVLLLSRCYRAGAAVVGVVMMRRVILESPYAGDVEANVTYARRALRDCLKRGEAPIASHLLYTQEGVLDDTKPDERSLGIEAGLAWGAEAAATVVYADRGISTGMSYGIRRAVREGRAVEYRYLDGLSGELA